MKGKNMNDDKGVISPTQAKAMLESLTRIERETNASIRPPLWLNLMIAGFYGMMTFSWASTRHENQWMLGLLASTFGFILAVAFYLYRQVRLGAKPKLVPKNKSELIFQSILALIFGLVFTLTHALSVDGLWWASYAGAAINALILAYSLHNYATGEFVSRTQHHE